MSRSLVLGIGDRRGVRLLFSCVKQGDTVFTLVMGSRFLTALSISVLGIFYPAVSACKKALQVGLECENAEADGEAPER